MFTLFQDAADALHLLTVQRQLHERVSGIPSLGGGTQRYNAPTPAPLTNPRGGGATHHTPAAGSGPGAGDGGDRGSGHAAAEVGDDGLFSSLRDRGREMQQQYKRRPGRVHLVGRQAPMHFGTFSSSSSCMYSAGHGTATFCDYCVPRCGCGMTSK